MRKPCYGAAVVVSDVAAAVAVVVALAVIGVAGATDAVAVTAVAVVAAASGGDFCNPRQIDSDSKRPIHERPHGTPRVQMGEFCVTVHCSRRYDTQTGRASAHSFE